jgi:ABC-type transporter Mla maintaining outer membrane lipid asymmetry ATPase subunit MlaF
MRRRLDLAASLILAPPVQFLDEPSIGLDPRSRMEVWTASRALVAACRELFGTPTVLAAHASLPLRHPVAATLGRSLLLLLVFVPLSVRSYQSAGR